MREHLTSFNYIIHEKTDVLDGTTTKANYKYVNSNHLGLFFLKTAGGVTILQEGNVSFAIVNNPNEHHYFSIVLQKFMDFLRSKGLEPINDGNDILVDGFKVCAFSSNYIEEYKWSFSSFTFTINIDLDLVRNVCNKPMVKIPKGLSEFGITREEILNLLEEVINETFNTRG